MNDKEYAKEEIGLRARMIAGQIEAYCSFLENQRLDHEVKSLIDNLRMTYDYLLHAAEATPVGDANLPKLSDPPLLTHLKQTIEQLKADATAFVAKEHVWLKCEEHPAKPDIDRAAAAFQNAYDDFLRIKFTNRPG